MATPNTTARLEDIDNITRKFDTLQDFKDSDKVVDSVMISGYYEKGDGAFGSLIHELLPDDGTVYTEIGGFQFKTASGRWYKLKYNGNLDISYFGIIVNSSSVNADRNCDNWDAMQIYVVANNISITSKNGFLYISRMVSLSTNSYLNGLKFIATSSFIASSTVETATLVRNGYDLFTYEKPTKAMVRVNSDITVHDFIARGGDFIDSDETMETNLAPLIGILFEGDTIGDTPYKTSNRNEAKNIYTYSCHTGIHGVGWVGNISKSLVHGSSLGMFWYQANGTRFHIAFENVHTPIIGYEWNASQIQNLVVDSKTTNYPSKLDSVQGLSINGYYHENSGFSIDSLFEIGKLIPIDANAQSNMDFYVKCYDIAINSTTTALVDTTNFKAYFDLDYVDGFTATGNFTSRAMPLYKKTVNASNINCSLCVGEVSQILSSDTTKPINFSHNNKFKHNLSGYWAYLTNSSYSIHNTVDGLISPIGGKIIKVTSNGGDGAVNFPLYSKFTIYGSLFGTLGATLGAWVYFPKNSKHDPADLTKMPVLSAYSKNDNTIPGNNSFVSVFDEWFYFSVQIDTLPDIESFSMNIKPNGNLAIDAGYSFYIASFDICLGNVSDIDMAKNNFVFDETISRELDGTLLYNYEPLTRNTIKGDKLVNSSTTVGALPYYESPAYNTDIGSWVLGGFPKAIPTTNNGVGTIWSNGGVLTLGS